MSRRTAVGVLGGVVIMAITAAVIAIVLSTRADRGDDGIPGEARGTSAERERAAPPQEQGADSVAYLQGPGAAVIELHDIAVARVAAGAGDPASCQADATRLDSIVSPAAAVELIAGVSDERLRAYLFDERIGLVEVLAQCLGADHATPVTADPLPGLAAATASVDRQLDALGWPR